MEDIRVSTPNVSKLMHALGQHRLVEYYDCDTTILNDKVRVREIMIEAVRQAKATIVTDVFHTFSPHGVSGVVVIAESHVAIHTWPEYGYAAVDIFTCSKSVAPLVIQDYLKMHFKSKRTTSEDYKRGIV